MTTLANIINTGVSPQACPSPSVCEDLSLPLTKIRERTDQIGTNRFVQGSEDGWLFTWKKEGEPNITIALGDYYGLDQVIVDDREWAKDSISVQETVEGEPRTLDSFSKGGALNYLRSLVKKTASIACSTLLESIIIRPYIEDLTVEECTLTHYGPEERFSFQRQEQQTSLPLLLSEDPENVESIEGYSFARKMFYGPVPDGVYASDSSFLQGVFKISRLAQTSVKEVLEGGIKGLEDTGSIEGLSLGDVLSPIRNAVGMMMSQGNQMGSCTLISVDLAILACHSIEDLDISSLEAQFDFLSHAEERCKTYRVKKLVEYDPKLDFAIVQFEGNPGQSCSYLKWSKELHPSEEPALLHCPLNKSLQVSVHTCDSTGNFTDLFATYHDSDYGSSGGAYITPLGELLAIHLGSEYDVDNGNLRRVALPVDLIMRTHPRGILSLLAEGYLSQADPYDASSLESIDLLPYSFRNFIDFEKFDRTKLSKEGDYLLRASEPGKPGLIIDSHQKKHTPSWPLGSTGGRGSTFSMNMDETIELAEIVGEEISLFSTIPKPKDSKPRKLTWQIPKGRLPTELGKKLKKVAAIHVEAGFEDNYWAFHMFPV